MGLAGGDRLPNGFFDRGRTTQEIGESRESYDRLLSVSRVSLLSHVVIKWAWPEEIDCRMAYLIREVHRKRLESRERVTIDCQVSLAVQSVGHGQ